MAPIRVAKRTLFRILQQAIDNEIMEDILVEEDKLISEDETVRDGARSGARDGEINLLKWWHVNKSGFPMAAITWDRMWQYIRKVHPEGAEVERMIRGEVQHKVSYPVVPVISSSSDVVESVNRIQCYLQELQYPGLIVQSVVMMLTHIRYNHTGTQFFDIKKYRSLSWLMETAKEMIRMSLPIKCLEAFILSLYFTASLNQLQRFAISFKSVSDNHVHRHVVMGIYHNNQFGALGLSRKKDLMNKPLGVKCLTDLILDYLERYQHYEHTVTKLKLSLPIPHDCHSHEPIPWKGLILKPSSMDLSDLRKITEKYSRTIKLSTA